MGASVSGTVIGTAGVAVGNVSVSAYSASGSAYATTDSSGAYTLRGIPAGNYILRFSPPSDSGYADQWWEGKSTSATATALTVAAAVVLTGKNVVLAAGSTISGTVTGVGGVAVPNISVSLQSAFGYDTYRSASTDAAGAYTFSGLTAGDYTLRFNSEDGAYVPQSWDGPLTIGSGMSLTGRDVSLQVGSSVSGRVTGVGGVAVADVYVSARHANGGGYASATTDASGAYTLSGLAAGDYTVSFRPSSTSDYVEQWWDGKQSESSATPLTVAAAATLTGKNVSLTMGGKISGIVTGTGGVPLPSVSVSAQGSNGGYSSATTDASGSYSLRGLAAGDYKVQFSPPIGDYVGQWWLGMSSSGSAMPLTVTAGGSLTGKNATLKVGATVSGTVTGVGSALVGGAIAGATVEAYSGSTGNYRLTTATTDAGGNYTLRGLPGGIQTLKFSAEQTPYVDQWLGDRTSFSTADTVTLTLGQKVTGQNALLTRGGSISGSATSLDGGAPLANSTVTVYSASDFGEWYPQGTSTTDGDGKYSFDGLPSGRYQLKIRTYGFAQHEQWLGGSSIRTGSDVVTLVGQVAATGKDFAVRPFGSAITGTVEGAAGIAMAGLSVDALTPTGTWITSAKTNAVGAYALTGLGAGQFKLRFSGNAEYLTRWSGGKTTLGGAAVVAVGANATLSGQNLTLVKGGTISGTVTRAVTGAPLAGVTVLASTKSIYAPSQTITDAAGKYTITGLPNANYTIEYSGAGNVQTWSGASETEAEATAVAIVGLGSVTGQDIALRPGGTLSGTVRGVIGGMTTPLRYAAVTLVALDGRFVASVYTDADGTYDLTGATPGTYKLRFDGGWSYGLTTQWWNNKATMATSDSVVVTAGGLLSGHDATLQTGGSISGTVQGTGSANIPLAGILVSAFATTGGYVGSTETDEEGKYKISNLAPNSYKVHFGNDGDYSYNQLANYAPQWWGGQSTQTTASSVPVASGVSIIGKNALLSVGSQIRGQATAVNDSGLAMAFATVTAWTIEPTPRRVASSMTDAAGNYLLRGLGSGKYNIQIEKSTQSGYADEWWSGSASATTATPIDTVEGTTSTGKDFTADLGGTISGRVTNTDGENVDDVLVSVWRLVDGRYVDEGEGAATDGLGQYSIRGLSAGTYTLGFTDYISGGSFDQSGGAVYEEQLWNNKATLDTATAMVVALGASLNGTDAVLTPKKDALLKLTTTPVPMLSGTAQVGKTLTASAGSWAPAPVTLAYSWQRDGVNISGANAASYKIVAADAGKKLTVTVEGSKVGYAPVATVSVATSAVQAAVLTATPVPTVSGTTQVGSTLMASAGTWAPAPVTLAYTWQRDGVNISGATASSYVIVAADAGKKVTVTVTGAKTGYQTVSKPSTQTAVITDVPGLVPRLSGADRFSASAAISTENFAPGVSTVYIANGLNFPDALSGAPVAAKEGSPVLLVLPDSIPDSIQKELTRLKPGRIVVLGGENSVSPSVKEALGSFTPGGVTRLSGTDRFSASAGISAANFDPDVATVYIANGLKFPDALSGAPVAAKEGAPVLLVLADSIPESIQRELERLKPGRIVVLGGENSVSPAVKAALGSFTAGGVTRLSGADRFAASAGISAANFESGVSTVYIANGLKFPDALSGAPVAAKDGAPVLLVLAATIPESIQNELTRLKPTKIVVLGGTASVSAAVAKQLEAYLPQ